MTAVNAERNLVEMHRESLTEQAVGERIERYYLVIDELGYFFRLRSPAYCAANSEEEQYNERLDSFPDPLRSIS